MVRYLHEWMEPFSEYHVENLDYIEAGRCFMRLWIAFTVHDVYLHPFGTVITNPRSHAAFVASATDLPLPFP